MGIFNIFKKKTDAEKNTGDRELIAANAEAIKAMTALTSDGEVKAELTRLENDIRYLIPLTDERAMTADKKIRNLIGDLKIELVKDKSDEKAAAKLQAAIKELKIAVAERRAMI
ncbi:MAG: hypothetical protein J6V07_04655 [Clostridia bacterium]|nr:hypothetical protein [Clostridia bacterium]